MSSATQPAQLSDVVLFEEDREFSREDLPLLDGETTLIGTVLGKLATLAAGSVVADAGNTGDADVSAVAPTLGAAVEVGDYALVCTAESANAGTFSVTSPSGVVLAALTVASAYTSNHINLTIPDGAEDWDEDDIITVTVPALYAVFDDTASNGHQTAAAVAIEGAAPSGADGTVLAIVRHAALKSSGLLWPATSSAAEQAAAIAVLAALGILVRTDA